MRWLFVLVLASCGRIAFDPLGDAMTGAPHDEDGTHSGTRLKVIWSAYEGDVRMRTGTYDSLRGEACTILARPDGTLRCVPDAMPTRYTDAGCTQAVGIASPCKVESYIAWSGRMFQRGPVAPLAQYYVPDVSGACVGPFATGPETYYSLGPEVPPTDLAELTEQRVPGGRLSEVFFESADGYRQSNYLYDTALDVACSAGAGFAPGACAPIRDSVFGRFRDDATCARVVAMAPTASPPRFAFYAPDNGCPSDFHYFRVATEISLQSVYQYIPSLGCTLAGSQAGYSYWSLGAEVFPEPMALVVDTAPGRFKRVYLQGGGITARAGALYDSALAAFCTGTLTSDGQLRCVPTGSTLPVTPAYRDATCTQPIDLATQPIGTMCPAPTPPTYAIRSVPTGGCGSFTAEVLTLGPVFAGTPYALSGTTCSPYTSSVGFTTTFYSLGNSVPVADLAPATTITDP